MFQHEKQIYELSQRLAYWKSYGRICERHFERIRKKSRTVLCLKSPELQEIGEDFDLSKEEMRRLARKIQSLVCSLVRKDFPEVRARYTTPEGKTLFEQGLLHDPDENLVLRDSWCDFEARYPDLDWERGEVVVTIKPPG